jgi:hypothetical protein
MTAPIWFFRPDSEQRVEVQTIDARNGEPVRWIVPCQACGTNFTLRPDHGVVIGQDGAITTEHSFNCPKCDGWHARFAGGVVVPL